MKLDVPTLALILSLTSLAQVVALYMQFRVNRSYRGIGWWLLGAVAMALGFIFLSLGALKGIGRIGIFGNPLLILGRVFVFAGTVRFVGRSTNRLMVWGLFAGFVAIYYYHLFIADSIASRTVTVSAAIALFSLLTAKALYSSQSRSYSDSAHFTGTTFLAHGAYLIALICYTVFSGPMRSYQDFSLFQDLAFVVPAITSTLWTFGFILMMNQRLGAENQEERENLQRVFNTSPDAALITRLDDGILVDANAGFSAMTGYSRGELIGQSLAGIGLWQDPAAYRAFVAGLREQGACANLEFGFRTRAGAPRLGMLSARMLTINALPHIISVARDITESRKAEGENAELEARNRQLQKAESLGRMAGAIAHHFNNQLQSVLGNLELLDQLPAGMDPVACLARARQATERAAEVSRSMLVYLGQTAQDQEPHFLAELCRDSLPLLQAALPKTAALAAQLPAPGPVVRANASQIQQVLVNLVTNAWEALGETPGVIRLGLGTCPAAAVPAGHRFPLTWAPRDPDYACLEVEDTGCGIAEADLEQLFDPFYSTKFTGRGLGLPVVLGLVQAHGGAVTVRSRLGEGSGFRVYLPIAAAAVSRRPGPLAAARPPAAGGTILLVDDDESLLMTVGALVELLGFGLLTARDGVEALAVFERHRAEIRCVVTDLTMPRMDGWETLEALRRLEPGLPVVLASGYDRALVMAGAHPELPQAFLAKPFDLAQLREALGQALDQAMG